MFTKFLMLFVLVVFLFQSIAQAQQNQKEDQVAFTTVDAPWLVMFPNKDLEIQDQQIKPDMKSGYFLLWNEKQGLTVSLFIEPAVKCKTSVECRDFVWKTGNPAWGKLQDVVRSKIGDAHYFEFFRPTIQGKPLQMFDMYAEFVENGYWVDLHISKVGYKKEDHQIFENLVKSIRFIPKENAKPVTESDKTIELARQTAEKWMVLWWDAGKPAESYNELSTASKSFFDAKYWSEHWAKMRKPLGKLKSRKLLNLSLIKSSPGAPGQPGAVFKYLSSFENRENVFEEFYLLLEKDGTWRMGVYETNQ
jgi:hypothetical protein